MSDLKLEFQSFPIRLLGIVLEDPSLLYRKIWQFGLVLLLILLFVFSIQSVLRIIKRNKNAAAANLQVSGDGGTTEKGDD